jgi:lipid-binding SYLF domain-containing protein
MRHFAMNRSLSAVVLTLAAALATPAALAESAEEIDIKVDATLETFKSEVQGGQEFLQQAAGVLVFPKVIKAGLIVGGERGTGALRVDGKSVGYYSTTAGSIGLQAGAQAKSEVIVFMTAEALAAFQASSGWEAGVDGNIAVVEWGAGQSLTTVDVKDPIVGFIFGNTGLMFDLSFEGSKFNQLDL